MCTTTSVLNCEKESTQQEVGVQCAFPNVHGAQFAKTAHSSQCSVYNTQFTILCTQFIVHSEQFQQSIGLNLQPAGFITWVSNLTTTSSPEDCDDCDCDDDSDDDCDDDANDDCDCDDDSGEAESPSTI